MNQPGYKEITNEASSLPIRWMSDHNQTVDASYAANGNSSSEYTIVSVYERWENVSVHRYFFTIKKRWDSLCSFIRQLPMVVSIMSKKQKMQTLNQDMQIL